MNLRNVIVAAGIVAMALTGTADAAPLPLSLGEAIRRGLTNGEEIQISNSTVREAEQQVRAARSAAFPQVNGALNYVRTIESPYSIELPEGSSLPFGNPNTWVAGVSVDQVVYSAGKVGAGLRIAKEYAGAAEAQRDEDKQAIALDVTQAYYDAVLASELAGIAQSSGKLMDEQLQQVRLLRSAGNASDLDVLRVQVERENLQPEITAAQNARDVALLNLLRLVNLPADTDLLFDDVLESDAFRPLDRAAIQAIVAGAADRRPAVKAAERFLEIRTQQVKIERSDSLPTVGANLSIYEQALPSNLFPGTGDFNHDWSASLGVTIPLFDGGRRKAEVAIAQQQQKQAELQLAQLREAVTLEVERQRRELERASSQIEARGEAVRQAQKVYELTELSYRVGNVDQLRLTDAREALRQARGNQATALHDYYIALARLNRAAGVALQGYEG